MKCKCPGYCKLKDGVECETIKHISYHVLENVLTVLWTTCDIEDAITKIAKMRDKADEKM